MNAEALRAAIELKRLTEELANSISKNIHISDIVILLIDIEYRLSIIKSTYELPE